MSQVEKEKKQLEKNFEKILRKYEEWYVKKKKHQTVLHHSFQHLNLP